MPSVLVRRGGPLGELVAYPAEDIPDYINPRDLYLWWCGPNDYIVRVSTQPISVAVRRWRKQGVDPIRVSTDVFNVRKEIL